MNEHQWHPIRTEADVQVFDELSNGLHDGHIIGVEFRNTGIRCLNCPSGMYGNIRSRIMVFRI